jgi:hypothetical protein
MPVELDLPPKKVKIENESPVSSTELTVDSSSLMSAWKPAVREREPLMPAVFNQCNFNFTLK